MYITGKESRWWRLTPVTVEVISYTKQFCIFDGRKMKEIYGQRRCFLCHNKFANGESLTVSATSGGNKVFCQPCSEKLPDPPDMQTDRKLIDRLFWKKN